MYNNNSSIKPLLKIHLCLLVVILLHTSISVATGYRLQQPLLLFLKIALYLSGLVLFFKTFRKSGLQRVYFFFYLLSALTAALFSILGGIFMALLATFLLFPIYPRETVYKSDNIIVYSRFQGLMASCCSYEVAKPKCFIFEQYRGIIRTGDPADRQSDSFSLQGNAVVYRHTITEYRHSVKTTRDTTETINLGK